MRKVSRPETWPDWVPEIVAMDAGGPVVAGDEVEGVAEMLGFRVAGRSRIVTVEPHRLDQDVVLGVRMTARYEVTPTPTGTLVTHELIVTRPEGVMGRILAFFLRIRLKRMQTRLLANLTERAEQDTSTAATAKEAPTAGT